MADMKKSRIKNKAGSLCIEIAIVYPFFLMIIFCFVFNMAIVRSEMLLKSTIIKESEKAGFLGIIGDYSTGIISELTDNAAGADESDFIMKYIYEQALKNQIRDAYQQVFVKNKSFKSVIKEHDEFLEGSLSEDNITLTSVYKVFTPFITIRKQFTIPLRLWNHGDHSGKVFQNGERNIWLYDNFERGRILRIRFGGNLPMGFPVLSGFSNGNALIINSMDLTAPSWALPSSVNEQMGQVVLKMAAYNGTLQPWGKDGISIPPEKIRYRYIKFIIPENLPSGKYDAVFEKIIYNALNRSIKVEIIPYQSSSSNLNKE